MYKIGDKFIIEIEDIYEASIANGLDINNKNPIKLYKMKGFNSLVFDEQGLDRLTTFSEVKAFEEGKRAIIDFLNESLKYIY